MFKQKARSITNIAKEVFADAVTMAGEVLLGKPITVQAGCIVDTGDPCTSCGSCGADKRKYQRYCWECDTCTVGCAYCPKGCACTWC